MVEGGDSSDKTPNFNSGLAKINRIDEARKMFNKSMVLDEWDNCVDCLSIWYIEMDYKMTDEERDKANKSLNMLLSQRDSRSTVYLRDIRNLAIWLGRIEHKYKLGMPETDDTFYEDDEV
jgi:hypothetical protein